MRNVTLIERNPPPGGVSYLLYSLIKNPEEQDPPGRTTLKLINFAGGSSGGVLFLRVLGLETTQQNKKPGGGGFLSINLQVLECDLQFDIMYKDSADCITVRKDTSFVMNHSARVDCIT